MIRKFRNRTYIFYGRYDDDEYKNIVFNNRKFKYKVVINYKYKRPYDGGMTIPEIVGCDTFTNFYEGYDNKVVEKRIFSTIIIEYPIYVFKLDFNIEDGEKSKKELRNLIEEKVKILDRRNEILKGDII